MKTRKTNQRTFVHTYTPVALQRISSSSPITQWQAKQTPITFRHKPRTVISMTMLELLEYAFLTEGLVPRIGGTLSARSHRHA